MVNSTISSHPFGKIALSCSGGGYRAASFHLGAMSYLNSLKFKDVPLLDNVEMISTVSGGTITGIVYALGKAQGDSFEEIYTFLLMQLKSLDLVELGIKKLNPDAVWQNKEKHKNLINAFAELYDANFTHGKTLADLSKSKGLKLAIFNSTEFNNAIDFRFRNIQGGYSGNYYLQVPKDLASEIKLSDCMAASSCFPGGFEPIIWPHDFIHANSPKLRNLRESGASQVGLMDGGIYDNQGIEAILNYKSGHITPYFDFIIISDVASPYMKPFLPYQEQAKEGWYRWTFGEFKLRLRRINIWLSIGLISAIILLAVLPWLWGFTNTVGTGISVGLSIACLVTLTAKTVAINYIRSQLAKLSGFIKKLVPEFYLQRLAKLNIDALSLHRAEPLIIDRVNSVVSLLMNVFLKVVRRLNYGRLYRTDFYKYRRTSNLIMELTQIDFENNAKRDSEKPVSSERQMNSILLDDYDKVVGSKIKVIAESAASFGTTLWFTEKEQLENMLDKLVATGQINMCYNMLKYLEKVVFEPESGFSSLDLAIQVELRETYMQCKSDWLAFKDDPLRMV